MTNGDNAAYFHFTGPQRLDRTIHTLEGILVGITIDRRINDDEIVYLTNWVIENEEFSNHHPFNEIIPRLQTALEDGEIDSEERADILWLCDKIAVGEDYYSQVTADMQRLQGMLCGIASDRIISEKELLALQEWMHSHTMLRTCWPYDALELLITSVLRDGKIDTSEHKRLLAFFDEFTSTEAHRSIDQSAEEEEQSPSGVICQNPEIVFAERRFCFTGKSERFTRKAFAEEISKRQGLFSKSVTRETHYLVVGSEGNECWAYSCYGRKVEQAVRYQSEGYPIVIVRELDICQHL